MISLPAITETTWQAAGEEGERAVGEALRTVALARSRRGHHQAEATAAAVGGLVAVADLLRAHCRPGGEHHMEEVAVASLRGALRGLEEAVRADGTPYTGASDA